MKAKSPAVLVAALWLVLAAIPLSAAEVAPAEQLDSLMQAEGEGNFDQAVVIARQILQTAQASEADLTAMDLFALAHAHRYLMIEAYVKALEIGGLPDEVAELATAAKEALRPRRVQLQTVSQGEKIQLEDYLIPGKTMIVDFYSDYCPPCRMLAPKLKELVEKRPDLAVVKVDINRPGHQGIDWQSPVAQQFGLRQIPHLKLYGPDGELVAEGDKAATQVFQWIEELE